MEDIRRKLDEILERLRRIEANQKTGLIKIEEATPPTVGSFGTSELS